MYSIDDFNYFTDCSAATFSAKVICDSVNLQRSRLTTMELTYPRCIHSEFMTHRVFSRNSASSRAIPMEKMIERIAGTPFIPLHWGKNQKGMQAHEELTDDQRLVAFNDWMFARDQCLNQARHLNDLGIHKQIGNRILEPWMWITVIASATNWENFFALRCHPDAEPHIQKLAYLVRNAYDLSTPRTLNWGDWHLPLVTNEELTSEDRDPIYWAQVSVGRCARVSYLTHAGIRDPEADIELYHRLMGQAPLHASPAEHQARAVSNISPRDISNFHPTWRQFRKAHAGECITIRQTP